MDSAEFRALMDEIKKSRTEVEERLTSSIADLKREVNSVQERTSQELALKINKSGYQFKKKSNEIQFHFNAGIEESIYAAKKELTRASPVDLREKEAVQKAGALLDEGLKALETRQKHIKVADRSDFGWSTVEHYESHPLAEDSDDEKKLEKAEKEAERAANKRRRGGGGAGNKRKCWPGPAGPSSRQREPQPTQVPGPPPLLPQGPVRPHVPVLGPCFFCGQFSHLVKSCPKKTLYPLKQPVVSKAERSADSHESGGVLIMNDMCHQSTTCEVSTFEVDVKQCVDNPGVVGQINSTEDMSFEGNPDEPYMEGETSIFWEVEANSPPDQITDVQGRLKKKILFWKEVLHAPPPIIDCITNGYRRPSSFTHPLIANIIRCQQKPTTNLWMRQYRAFF